MQGINSNQTAHPTHAPGPPLLVEELRSLDQNERAQVAVARPDRYRDILRTLESAPSAIPRGKGLSYCLASAGADSVSVSMTMFDRILDFSRERGEIVVEAGLGIGSLQAFVSRHGLWFPVLPGYPSISIGGCIAMNVHGKSQYHTGLFGEHVAELWLSHPEHGDVRCSPETNKDLFELTLGGFGLTGVITRARLRLGKRRGNSIERTRVRTASLNDAVKLMVEKRDQCDQIYSWNDLNLSGDNFGRGYVYLERFSPEEKEDAGNERLTGCLDTSRTPLRYSLMPRSMLKAIPHAYRAMELLKPEVHTSGLLEGAFPLIGKEGYFQLCAAKKFREAQIIVPYAQWGNFSEGLNKLRSDLKVATSLGSLKLFRGSPRMLNFEGEGVCLAVDLPAQRNDIAFLEGLDALMLGAGGIPNISKDSRLGERVVRASFPQYGEFRRRLRAYDPEARMQSQLRSRLGV